MVNRKRTTSTSPNGRQRIPDPSERKPQPAARLAKSRTDGKARRRFKLGFRYADGGRSSGSECAFTYTTCRICTSHRRICVPGTARSLVRPPPFVASVTSQPSITQLSISPDHCYLASPWGNYPAERTTGPDIPLSTSRRMLATMPPCWASPAAPPRVITSSIRAL
jgi:hypothetical protein